MQTTPVLLYALASSVPTYRQDASGTSFLVLMRMRLPKGFRLSLENPEARIQDKRITLFMRVRPGKPFFVALEDLRGTEIARLTREWSRRYTLASMPDTPVEERAKAFREATTLRETISAELYKGARSALRLVSSQPYARSRALVPTLRDTNPG